MAHVSAGGLGMRCPSRKGQATASRISCRSSGSCGRSRKNPARSVRRFERSGWLSPVRGVGENGGVGDKRSEVPSTSLARTAGPEGFLQLERAITERLAESNLIPEENGWEQVEGCWCFDPSSTESSAARPTEPKALVHFVGGAFVGASPQLTYRYFLEQLASRGFFVIATPFETNFEHLKIADDVYLKYTKCVRALGPRVDGLQTIGVGHSLGALEQLLLCSRYKDLNENRAGNVLISFNNKPVTDAIPFYAELIAPASSQFVAPLLQQLGTMPQASMMNTLVDSLRGQTPDFIQKNVFPLIDQLVPIYEDIAQDRLEFSPTPDESKAYIEKRYLCTRNLLVQFRNDTIDETPALAETLQNRFAKEGLAGQPSVGLELTVNQVSGDHVTPCKQPPSLVEDQVSQFSEQSKSFLGGMVDIAGMAQGLSGSTLFSDNMGSMANAMQKGIDQLASDLSTNLMSVSEVDQVDDLVDLLTRWSGVEPRIVRALPSTDDQG
ncbi:DUF1350 domain-containing protein [Chloropicon primus]|uniref:DUF1350 domain-containing protein n=1 Tax=Chloropicon primus TaxID=1764295 RepID=A0A5B8ML86_9CHLO|nr:DUF1350 domain-containing protein [Chloropicon primus]UPR00437.1 DUF1350 domain-containing protein [Chloropicon primus]|mmetsp:Transcript_3098/g.8456  ORF Transcript_3098/g.8456 Transcript_3098/m.8456 type:complete len:496 (-) Transcript_3098:965-2452(-)|eukprot:QDZ21223.1 DUF1350 domain-containing protein [Chloropicon primus]